MAADYHRNYTIRLPLPLAQLYSRAHNAKSARDRHDLTYFLFEAAVRMAVAPLVLTYLKEIEHGQPRSAIVERGLIHLSRPSAGHWIGLLRELSKYFGERVDADTHPLGHLWRQLTAKRSDLAGALALYRRIKNGPDGPVANDTSLSLLGLLDALVPYRNKIIGHGGVRDAEFYESQIGPLLFPAANDLFSENVLDLLGPPGSRLISITEIRMIDKGRFEIGMREVTGLQGERCPPLIVDDADRSNLIPNTLAVLWPGRTIPLRLDPLLMYRESELSDEMWFLNSVPSGRYVEYLNYANSKTEQNRALMADMAALLSRISGRTIDESELVRLGDQSQSESQAMGIAESQPLSPTGRVVGDYEILAELGRGGMGIVYLARQLSLGRLLALKFLPPELQSNDVAVARFRREMRLLARCDDPRIIKIVSSGTLPDGQPFYAMEYVPGCDLEQVWKCLAQVPNPTRELSVSHWSQAIRTASNERREQAANRSSAFGAPRTESTDQEDSAGQAWRKDLPEWFQPLPELSEVAHEAGGYVRKMVQLVCDAAEAVATLHAQNLLHRDIKPTNLMITPDGSRIVLMDFGLAKGDSTGLTREGRGDFLGTMRYAAPEQLAAANVVVGKPADVRALGIVLWELLTRKRLFADAEDLRTLAPRVLNDDVPLLRSVDPSLSPDLEAIVARATERRIADRIPDAATLASYLHMYLNGQPLPIRPPTLGELSWRWAKEHQQFVVTAACSIALIVATIAVSFGLVDRARRTAEKLAADLESTNGELDIAIKKEQEQAFRIRSESAKAFFASGNADYAAGRTQAGCQKIFKAWKFSSDDDPLKPGYERVLVDRLTRGGRVSLPFWNESSLMAVRIVNDGQTVLTASRFGKVRFWDVATGMPMGKVLEHPSWISTLAMSPDDTRLVVGCEDKTARLWNVQARESYATLAGHEGSVDVALFSPDGLYVATASGNAVRFWDAISGQLIGKPIRLPRAVQYMVYSPDSQQLVTGASDGTVRFLEAKAQRQRGRTLKHEHSISAMAFSDDGDRVFTASSDHSARIWNSQSLESIGEPMVHDAGIACMALSADGQKIITGSWDKTARLWDANTGASLGELLRHRDAVTCVAFCPNGLRVITGCQDHAARIWDVGTRELVGEPLWHAKGVGQVAFSSDGTRVVTGSGDESARIWEVDESRPIGKEMKHGDMVLQLAFTKNGSRIISSSADMQVRSWDTTSGDQRYDPINLGEPGFIPLVFFASNATGDRVVTWTGDESAQLWDATTGKPIGAEMRHEDVINTAALSLDGKLVATASNDDTARLWDAATGLQKGASLRHDQDVTSLLLSDDGTRLLTAHDAQTAVDAQAPLFGKSYDQQVSIWDTATGQMLGKPLIHEASDTDSSIGMAMSQDGKRIVTWLDEGDVRVWNAETQQLIGFPFRVTDSIYHAALHPNGVYLLVLSQDGTCQLWNVEQGVEVREPIGLAHQDEITSLTIDNSGQQFLTASADRTTRRWDFFTGAPLGAPLLHTAAVFTAAQQGDGQIVATGGEDGVGQVWDTASMPIPTAKARWFEWLLDGASDSGSQDTSTKDVKEFPPELLQDQPWQEAMRAFHLRRSKLNRQP
jgi:WD40 repeat protein/serine/threonine protein kinase